MFNCSRTLDSASAAGRWLQIRLPSGTFVQSQLFSWGMNVLVHVLGHDFNNTRGLCGNFNGDDTDDAIIQNTSILDTSSQRNDFVNSWRSVNLEWATWI